MLETLLSEEGKKFIRKEEKFKNLDELINQMKKDVEDIRKLMKNAI